MKGAIKHPVPILLLLTALNFVNYIDRFILAAVLLRIQAPVAEGGLALTNFEAGLLATMFMLGYFVTAPIFGRLGDRMNRKLLIAAGVAAWSVATVATGLSQGMVGLIVARVVVGVGEASYATLAPTIIDDVVPQRWKGTAMAVFFLAVPCGSACGYLLGGMLQKVWGWREAFFVAGGPGIVLALLCLLIAEPTRQLRDKAASGAFAALSKIALYRRAVFGYCAHTAAIGAFAYWGPKFLAERFTTDLGGGSQAVGEELTKVVLASATFWFGLVTVVAGAIGTVVGGIMADAAVRGLPTVAADASHLDPANRTAANAQLRVCAFGVAIAAPATAAAFFAPSAMTFFVLAGVAEIGLFLSAAPINTILMRTAPAYLRASAMAVAIFAIHLLGDLWSPSLVGLLLDYLVPTIAMMVLPVGFAVAAAIWWPRKREAL